MYRAAPCSAAFVATFLAFGPAVADPHPLTMGADPWPVAQADVELAREDLSIEVRLGEVHVEAFFRFVNRGTERTLDVGFPCAAGKWAADSGLTCKDRLDVRVNGKRVRPGQARNGAGESFRRWKMRFAAATSTELRLRYRTRIVNDRYAIPLAGTSLLRYRLVTGALWAGPIGELNISVTVPADMLALIRPAGYQRAAGRLTWQISRQEPREDLVLGFPLMAVGRFLSLFGARSWNELLRKLEGALPAPAAAQHLVELLQRPSREHLGFLREQYLRLRPPAGGVAPDDAEQREVQAESSRLLLRRLAGE